MLNLSDVVALARAGYSVKDVKELMELSKSQPETTQSETEDHPQLSQSEDVSSDNVAATAPKESEQPAAEPDYKAMYEAEAKKVSDLQNKNNMVDVSTPAVSEQELLDIVKSFT